MTSQSRSSSVTSLIDHTLLRADATSEEVDSMCEEAVRYGFAAVCVNPWCVRRAAKALKETGVAVCSVAGFPLGASTGWTKSTEAQGAVGDGATEIDVVINVGALRSGVVAVVEEELSLVRRSIGGAVLKAILELPLLSVPQAEEACRIAIASGADYVKTGTGVVVLRRIAGPAVGVKAAGGIRTLSFARELIAVGATRLGTSHAASIAEEELGEAR
jgi:deoxyribose-phosphate aldolase